MSKQALVPLGQREQEVLRHIKQGQRASEIATQMGIMEKSVRAYASNLRNKGYLPRLPEDHKGRHRDRPVLTAAELERQRLAEIREKESTGLAVREVLPEPLPEAKTPTRRKSNGGASITTGMIARQLEDEIKAHMAKGGNMEKWHRWALVLTGEILGE